MLLLGSCSAYLVALVGFVTSVVGLDLAGRHHNRRLLHASQCTIEQWAAVLRADNRIHVELYSKCADNGLSAEQVVFERCAQGHPRVYLGHPTFPRGLVELGLGGWAKKVDDHRWTKVVNEKPRNNGLNSLHPHRDDGEQERRQRMQVLVSHSEECLGLSGDEREEKRRDNFYTDLQLPPELQNGSAYLNNDCPTLYNFGPFNTRTHHDGWAAGVSWWKAGKCSAGGSRSTVT